ncbi:hypothetical protein [Paenibacillus mendelii]|uniref:Uncharacterized protein n=1 Tax=Paenibacillus mendelii TaxID=206163 RepID=A0ABV6JJ16_9BACL|nr:hypothetical protein [Paenibacillus mendelii]MCQ6558431.1 hypothetical protein [Paenibacillus mendelii]
MNRTKDLSKLINLTGDRAKLDAKANGTYIVYMTREGHFVREYNNGDVERIDERDLSHG